jgi:hypothetical protein
MGMCCSRLAPLGSTCDKLQLLIEHSRRMLISVLFPSLVTLTSDCPTADHRLSRYTSRINNYRTGLFLPNIRIDLVTRDHEGLKRLRGIEEVKKEMN